MCKFRFQCLVALTTDSINRKRLRIGYNSESFSTKSTLLGRINRIHDEIPLAWDEICLDGGWVDLISSKHCLDFICHRQISSHSDFILAFLIYLCYNIIKEVISVYLNLLKKRKKERKNKHGFTLVELVIAMAVIAILAAVVFPTFTGIFKKSTLSADIQTAHQMNTALSFYTQSEIEDVGDAKIALMENEIDASHYKPRTEEHEFYYVEDENTVLLFDEKTNEVIFPEKFKDKTYDSDTWITIGGIGNQDAAKKLENGGTLDGVIDLKGASISIDLQPGENFEIGGTKDNPVTVKNLVCDEYVKNMAAEGESRVTLTHIGMISYVPAGSEVTVKNMVIDGAVIGETGDKRSECVGIIAGEVYGNVTLENVTIRNSAVFGSSSVGTLFGSVAEGASVTLKNVTVENTVVKGVKITASLIGQVCSDINSITATNVTKSNVKVKISDFNVIRETISDKFTDLNGDAFILDTENYVPHLTNNDFWGPRSFFDDSYNGLSRWSVKSKNFSD